MTWLIVVIVVILIIVLLGVAGAKSEKNKNITIQKKQEEKNEKINRIKNNDTVKSWCNEIVSIMLPIIKKEPHKDCSIEIKSEKEHFLVGYNFQMRYLTYSHSYVYKEEPDVLYKYNFAEHGLPELSFSDRELFSETFAEMVKEEFRKLGHKCTTIGYPVALNDTNEEYSLYLIRYDRVVNNNTW